MDYAAVMGRQAARKTLLGNGYDGTLRTYSRRRGHRSGIGDAAGNDGRRGKLKGVKRKTGSLEGMGTSTNMNMSDWKTGEEEIKRSWKKSDIEDNKKKMKRKNNTSKLEAEKENKVDENLSRGNDKSLNSVTDDARDKFKIGKSRKRDKIIKAQEPYTKSIHSSGFQQRGKGRKAIAEEVHARKKPDGGAEDNEKTGTTVKPTPLMKEKNELNKKSKSEQRQGYRSTDKVQKTVKARQLISSNRKVVDSIDTGIRSEIIANAMTIGDDEHAARIGNAEGEIMQATDQSKQNSEVDVVEAFRQHVESERKHLTSLIKQAQSEEINRQEEHAKTIAREAANAFDNAHASKDYNESVGSLTEQNHDSITNPALPIILRPYPYHENTAFLLEQSHILISKYATFKEQTAHFLHEDAKDVEQQLVTFMSNRKRKQEEAVTVLGDLYARADKDIKGVIEWEERKMIGIGKGVRRAEKSGTKSFV